MFQYNCKMKILKFILIFSVVVALACKVKTISILYNSNNFNLPNEYTYKRVSDLKNYKNYIRRLNNQIKLEKERQYQMELQQEKENEIYRKYLASFISGSFRNDFHTSRY